MKSKYGWLMSEVYRPRSRNNKSSWHASPVAHLHESGYQHYSTQFSFQDLWA